MAQVDVIIVNWNAGEQLRQCLDSIVSTTDPALLGRVVVVDNASTDNSLESIDTLPLSLTVIRNRENRGFAAACNQGAAVGCADYLLFLNPDTRLNTNSLVVPLKFMSDNRNAKVGICSVQLLDDAGRVARSCRRFPTPIAMLAQTLGLDHLFTGCFCSSAMLEWPHDSTRDVDQVIGAFLFTRRSLFERLGGFDQRFHVYYEEVDYCLAAGQAGYRTVYLADAQAYHRGGGTSEQARSRRLFYSLRSRLQYAAKHFSPSAAAAVALATLLIEPCARLIWSIVRLRPREVVETICGFLILWADLPRLLMNSDQCQFICNTEQATQ